MSNYVSEEWGEVYRIDLRAVETKTIFPNPSQVSRQFFSPDTATAEKSPQPECFYNPLDTDALALVVTPPSQLSLTEETAPECTALAPPIWHQRLIEYPPESDHVYTIPTPAQPTLRLVKPALVAAMATAVTCSAFYLSMGINIAPLAPAETTNIPEVIDTSKVRLIEMTSPKNSSISAQLYLDEKKNQCLLYMKNLPESANDQTYQVWYYTKDANFVQAAAFKGNQGTTQLRTTIPREISHNIDRIFVSLESRSGAKFPAGPILLRGKV